ncbi:signal recognition particle-docking protein FtsY [Xanthomonas citri pv. glycines]|uniref:Signal recognition particle receptor FtsY n=1 Tax=Xanthomonas campestris pv. glycines TaxID=473421 RepID=A0AAX0I0M7_XANCG|nr:MULTISPECIES: signal recognition particle-docking protein FtsY [Xanthomonas]OOW54493.1 cell division protein FtsY [Xanthomonas campestris pv. centellae]AOY62617.1 signal recognition particle-docking protein FtsY [Xanthomonas citri pv. glycines str. 8ra]ARV23658.1 signal recognition particle-docking protein FtsY [Xanthomonas citri pv. glycines str. 12-2]OEY90383.1 signal recognition particle-docking protein FtsY [Xanthomonas citri pv. glycines]OOX07593.1 cell division protein FtsY [Xanthomon
MASFFRRNKPTTPDSSRTSRYSLEELAAAFPTAPSAATPASPVEAVPNAEPEREAAATPVVAPVTPAPAGGEPAAPAAPIPPQITAAPADQLAQEIAARTGQAQSIAAVPSAPAAPAAPAPTALQALPDPIPASAPSAPVVVPPPVVAQPQTVPTPPPAVPAQPVSPLQSAAPAVVAPPVAAPPASTPAPAAATPAGAPPISAAPTVTAPAIVSAPLPSTQDDSIVGQREALPAAPAGKPGWRERLRNSTFARSFGGLFSRNPKLDDDLLDEIETALITADVGIGATTALIDGLRKRMKSREFVDAQAMFKALRADLIALLQPVSKPLVIDRSLKPFVVLTVGVNGVGKTTTIGKLAKRFKDEGNSLMLAAGDTFRAAAVAQLQAWGDRNGVAVIAQGQNADAASVAFDALQAAKARGTDVLIADTAGRLHTQTGLMNELGKIRRVLGKIDAAAPHEVLMVIDGTTGQNAISQLRQFHAAVGVTGLVVTKLDGTAKGGVVFALAREFNIPIRFAGIGERPEDLRVFDPVAFVDALLPDALGG